MNFSLTFITFRQKHLVYEDVLSQLWPVQPCPDGDIADLKKHIKAEHEVVKYKLDLNLVIALLTEGEVEELVRKVKGRLDGFQKTGALAISKEIFCQTENAEGQNASNNDFDNLGFVGKVAKESSNEVQKDHNVKEDQDALKLNLTDLTVEDFCHFYEVCGLKFLTNNSLRVHKICVRWGLGGLRRKQREGVSLANSVTRSMKSRSR